MAVFGVTSLSGYSSEAAGKDIFYSRRFAMPENGWITDIGWYGGGTGGAADYRVGLYDSSRSRIATTGDLSAGTAVQWRDANINGKRINGGVNVWPALLIKDSSSNGANIHVNYGVSATNHIIGGANLNALPSDNSTNGSAWVGNYAIRATYQPNVDPTTPSALSVANSTATSLTPTFSGTVTQGADSAYDEITHFNVVVRRVSDNALMYSNDGSTDSGKQWQALADGAGATSPFSFTLPGGLLASATQYKVRVQAKDSWGATSNFYPTGTTWVNFTTASGPSEPVPVAPINRINTLSPTFTATHQHPSSLTADQAQLRVLSATGQQLATTYTTGTISVAAGSNISIAETSLTGVNDIALAWGTSYQWVMKVRDINGNYGPEVFQTFNTDAPPDKPVPLSPLGDAIISDASVTLSCRINDPDGDPITQVQFKVYEDGVSTPVINNVNATTIDNTTKTATYVTSALTYGKRYYWQAQATANATGGPQAGYGSYSDAAYFKYLLRPSVSLVGPSIALSNLVPQPSAEYDTTDLSAHWTVTAPGTSTITRVEEDAAPYGTHLWEAIADGTSETKMETTGYIDVAATKAYAFFVWAKGVSGTPTSSFQVVCYDASSTPTGTLTPGETTVEQLSAEVVPNTWTRYGGLVMATTWTADSAAEFPANTVKVKLRFIAAGGTSAGTVQFDAFMASQLSTNPGTIQERIDAAGWFGYADGDEEGFGGSAVQTATYSWDGVAGDSTSSILPVLQDTSPSVVINYSHPSGTAKGDDRVVIEEWKNNAWRDAYDSNPNWTPSNGAREIIPIPTGELDNEARYRLTVYVRDTGGLENSIGPVEFDVYYVGPPQLNISLAEALPAKAQVRLQWSTDNILIGNDFAGIEIQRVDLDGEEDTVILNPVITNASETEYIDHYPASGRNYRYRVRQKQNVNGAQVGGFWASVDATCDYAYSFLKDVANPELFSAFDIEAQNLVGYSEDAPVGVLTPWGAERPTVLQRWKLRTRTGEVVAGFFPDAGIELGEDFPDADTRFQRAASILKRRQTIAILTPAPLSTKVFAAIMGEARATFPYPPRVKGVEFAWQEVSFSEDYYEQNGLT